MRRSQGGMALISVLFILVIITVLLSQLITRSWTDLERTQWLIEDAQAFEYALGGEQLARQILFADMEELKKQGLTVSPIPRPASVYTPEHGEMRLKITDLQGLVNLNAVGTGAEAGFVGNFMTSILHKPALAQALADWVDEDSLPRSGGAEDYNYLSRQPAYRSANRNMADPSELNCIDAIDPVQLGHVEHWLVALDQSASININTLPAELVGLIDPNISAAQFEAVRSASPRGFHSIDEFIASDVVAGLAIDPSLLTTVSSFYSANMLVRTGESMVTLSSRFRVDSATGNIALLDRTLLMKSAIKQELDSDQLVIHDDTDPSF